MFLIQALDTLEHLSLRDYVYEEASRGPDLISSRGQCFPLQHTLWRPAAAQMCLYRAKFNLKFGKMCWQNVRIQHLKMITFNDKSSKGKFQTYCHLKVSGGDPHRHRKNMQTHKERLGIKSRTFFYHINTCGAAPITCSTYEKQSWNFSLFIFLPLMKMSPKSVPAFPIRPATASSSVVFPEPENRKNT